MILNWVHILIVGITEDGIMLGDEDIPISPRRNKIMKGETYMDKVLKTSIKNVNKDKNR
jgi:hypothetical protein